MTTQPDKLILSLVTPVYRGEEYLEKLADSIDALRKEFEQENAPIELAEAIFVDDSSIDNSDEVLRMLEQKYSWVRVIYLSRNYGQHSATIAGILHSVGDWIATIDEDLQHHPVNIPLMLAQAVRESQDIVYAKPIDAVHGSWYRDVSSRAIKWFVSILVENDNVRKFNSFRLIRGSVARAAAAVACHDTYFDMALCWFSNRITGIRLNLKDSRYQQEAVSGYTFRALMAHSRRLLISSPSRLLRMSSVFGIMALAGSLVVAVFILFSKLMYPDTITVSGWTTLMIWVLFFGGLTSFMLGVMLEYFSVVLQVQGKPSFFVIDRSSDSILNNWIARIPQHANLVSKIE